jgi:hypothetical protein
LGVFDLQDYIENDVLPEVAGGLGGACGGALINSIPTELDCNAAASVYLAGRFSAAELDAIREGPRKHLACSLIPPPPLQTLPARMIAFAYLHCEAAERQAARHGFPVASMLRAMYPQAPALWSLLEKGVRH